MPESEAPQKTGVPSWVKDTDENSAADSRDQPWKLVIDKLEKEREEGQGPDGNKEGDYIDLRLKNAVQCGCE
jgi:hypothetical protein